MNKPALASSAFETDPSDHSKSDQPTVIGGRWEVIRLLAQGGMGAVYVTKHKITGRLAAVKTLPFDPSQEGLLGRFQREAQVTAQIGHPGIVEILDADQDPETQDFYIAMELLTGDTLREKMDHPNVSAADILRMVYQMLDPLIASHRKGVVHRDLKPENIFVIKNEGKKETVKLLDFGIALQSEATRMTQAGLAMGTPGYMSPEQATDAAKVNAATDIWAIGVMLYEAYSNELPFDGPSANAIVVASCTREPIPLRDKVPDIDPKLEEIIHRCLRKDPEQRFANSTEIRDALENFFEESFPQKDKVPNESNEDSSLDLNENTIDQLSNSGSMQNSSSFKSEVQDWGDDLEFDLSKKSHVKPLVGGVAVVIALVALGLGISGAAPMGVAIGGVIAAIFVIATLVLMKNSVAAVSDEPKKRQTIKQKKVDTISPKKRTHKTKRPVVALAEDTPEEDEIGEEVEKPLREKGPSHGSLTISIYGDFMDPSTHQALSAANYIQKKYPEDILIVWHDLPNRHRPPSNWAARAGIETFVQSGNEAFWDMCDLLFQKGEMRLPKLKGYAERLDLDVAKFLDAVEGTVHDEEIAEEQKLAQELGIQQAPAFVIRGRVLMGSQMLSSLGDVVEQILFLQANPVDPTQPSFQKIEEERIPEEMGLRQILVKWAGATNGKGVTTRSRGSARDRAIRLRKRVSKEEANFVALARQFSDAPMEVGLVKLADINQPVLGAIRKLKEGGVCEVVETEEGFHIFQRYC